MGLVSSLERNMVATLAEIYSHGPKHNNLSAINAHGQLAGTLKMMSLADDQIVEIRKKCKEELNKELEANNRNVKEKRLELKHVQSKFYSLEEKFLDNSIAKDTYQRWYSSYSQQVIELEAGIERLEVDNEKTFKVLERNLSQLGNLNGLYEMSDTLKKQELISLVFDSNLYYQDGIYRTPTILPIFSGNQLKMKDKGYLVYEKKGMIF